MAMSYVMQITSHHNPRGCRHRTVVAVLFLIQVLISFIMASKNKLKYVLIATVLVMAGFAMADALGYFNSKSYTKVSKGSHAHYVPNSRDPDVSIDRFPKRPPGPNEKISPNGKMIKTND